MNNKFFLLLEYLKLAIARLKIEGVIKTEREIAIERKLLMNRKNIIDEAMGMILE